MTDNMYMYMNRTFAANIYISRIKCINAHKLPNVRWTVHEVVE